MALGTVILGLIVAPGKAMTFGRLGGALWGIPATQVAHYAAVATGLVVLLWIGGRLSGRRTLYSAAALQVLDDAAVAAVGMDGDFGRSWPLLRRNR